MSSYGKSELKDIEELGRIQKRMLLRRKKFFKKNKFYKIEILVKGSMGLYETYLD